MVTRRVVTLVSSSVVLAGNSLWLASAAHVAVGTRPVGWKSFQPFIPVCSSVQWEQRRAPPAVRSHWLVEVSLSSPGFRRTGSALSSLLSSACSLTSGQQGALSVSWLVHCWATASQVETLSPTDVCGRPEAAGFVCPHANMQMRKTPGWANGHYCMWERQRSNNSIHNKCTCWNWLDPD